MQKTLVVFYTLFRLLLKLVADSLLETIKPAMQKSVADELRTHQVKLPVSEASQLGDNVEEKMKQRVEDDQPAPQGGHRQFQQALKGLQVTQLVEGPEAVDYGGRDILLGDNQAEEGDHHQLGNAPVRPQTAV